MKQLQFESTHEQPIGIQRSEYHKSDDINSALDSKFADLVYALNIWE